MRCSHSQEIEIKFCDFLNKRATSGCKTVSYIPIDLSQNDLSLRHPDQPWKSENAGLLLIHQCSCIRILPSNCTPLLGNNFHDFKITTYRNNFRIWSKAWSVWIKSARFVIGPRAITEHGSPAATLSSRMIRPINSTAVSFCSYLNLKAFSKSVFPYGHSSALTYSLF